MYWLMNGQFKDCEIKMFISWCLVVPEVAVTFSIGNSRPQSFGGFFITCILYCSLIKQILFKCFNYALNVDDVSQWW